MQPLSSYSQSGEYMRANLYYIPASGPRILIDGNFTQYDNQYSNQVDINDVWKMTNIGENFGIIRQGYTLVMERRQIVPVTDTTYFRLWNLQQKDYQMEIVTHGCNHPDLEAILVDAFTSTTIPVLTNDTTRVNFTVNAVPGSAAQNRFTLVYKTIAVNALPIAITSVSSRKINMGIGVDWKVENESGIASYIVEKSADGINFSAIDQVRAANTNSLSSYFISDLAPFRGDNYYRIHAITVDSRNILSAVTKTRFSDPSGIITIYPNPVINKNINMKIDVAESGEYKINIYQSTGFQIAAESLRISSPAMFNMKLPANTLPGIYNIIITGPSNFRQSERVIIL